MSLSKLGEAKRLHALGCAVHWLRPNSKVPVKSGWSGDSKDTMKELKSSYKTGYNIGTKLGKPSAITVGETEYYLAAIDVDVKGTNKKYTKEARDWLEKHFPGLLASAPITYSGRGNGSMHVWCLVQSSMDSRKLTQSSEVVKVHMPSVTPSKNDKEKLTEQEVNEGFRMRPAWEVDFMCAGRQVVLPPSIHPDSGKAYRWGKTLESVEDLSIITRSQIEDIASSKQSRGRPEGSISSDKKMKIVDPDEMKLETKLEPKILDGIYEGEGVEDRSAFCLSVAIAMVRARFSDAEILGVLTNKEYFIGDVAFNHSKSSSRYRAARWVQDYCIRKAREEVDAAFQFNDEVEVYETLPPEKREKQLKRLVSDLGQVDWRKKLDRNVHDKVKPTFKNIVLILENEVAKDLVKYDLFSHALTFNAENPWGSVVGAKVQDIDTINCRLWFAHSGFKIEPNVKEIGCAFRAIAAKNSYHAVKEHLESLPAWDGTPRLSTWMKRLLGAVAPEPYLSHISRKFLISAVARIYNPGCKVDNTVIFEGLQGIGKSTIGRILATDKWFLDQLPDLHDKDSSQILQGNWFIELGELSSLRRSDVETTKQYLTRSVDKFRPPYGEHPVEFARQCVFFGTTNASFYLKDKTGNRRFWPTKVNEIDLEGLKAERDQLFAEAMIAFEMGEKLYLDKEVEEQARDVQSERVVEEPIDIMLDKLTEWKVEIVKARKDWRVKNPDKPMKAFMFKLKSLFEDFSDTEFGTHISPPLGGYKNDGGLHTQWAGECLSKIGFEKKHTKNGNCWKLI